MGGGEAPALLPVKGGGFFWPRKALSWALREKTLRVFSGEASTAGWRVRVVAAFAVGT